VRRDLVVTSVAVVGLRNLASVDLMPGPAFNVISGDNGQGKTNLLEALYLVSTSKSFRAHHPSELISFGGTTASVRVTIREGVDERTQILGIEQGKRHAQVNGTRPRSLLAYALLTPAVAFHPGDSALSLGGGAERRRLLDRVALHVAPFAVSEVDRYKRALQSRQRTLELRGRDARDLDAWENLVVEHGLRVIAARAIAASELASAGIRAFERIGAPELRLGIDYRPGAPTDPEAFRLALAERRANDLRRGSTSVGPHRDDLSLTLGGHPARGAASQGQHRAIVLALKLAEVEIVGTVRGTSPLLLLDDVSSELDRDRTTALFAALREHRGQVFLTTTRRELIDAGVAGETGSRVDFVVSGGGGDKAGF
jgi:DNA replication and repair protein RecF